MSASSLLLAALIAPSAQVDIAEALERPPHVVLILADDLGIGDLGAYNPESKIPTPHLDELAQAGLRFTDAHSPSGVCSPTRYGLLTGRYAWRTELKSGVLWGSSPALIEPDRPTIASVLASAGYDTAAFGKWHLGLGEGPETDWDEPLRPGPLDIGFDAFFGIAASLDMPPYVFVEGDAPLEPATRIVSGGAHRRIGGGGFWRPGPIAASFSFTGALPRIVDEAIEWIEARGPEPDPFFVYLPLTAPHTPWVPTEEFHGTSEAGWYGDFVAMVDSEIGRVLAALARLELADDTLVIVTSDNGSHWPRADVEHFEHAANLDWRGQKADIWEGGHRVPFLVRWPGRVAAGAETDALASHVDLFPTIAALAGAKFPEGAAPDGVDQSAVLLGTGPSAREVLVMHSFDGMFAIRVGDWKLIEGLGSGGFTRPVRVEPEPDGPRGQLYDLSADPGERANRWLEEAAVRERLTERLDAIRN